MSFNLRDEISKYQHLELSSPYIFYGIFVVILCCWWKSTELKNPSGLPVIGRRWYELGSGKARQRFRDDCLGIVRSCLEKVSDILVLINCPYLILNSSLSSMEMRSICIPTLGIA